MRAPLDGCAPAGWLRAFRYPCTLDNHRTSCTPPPWLTPTLLAFSPKFAALIQTIPGPVLGGVSIVVFGLIAVAGARIWVENGVDFGDNRNLIVAAVTLVLGAGDFTLKLGNFTLGGIGTATFGALILYALLRGK